MQVLVFTPIYPTPEKPARGTFVKEQVDSLREAGVDIEVYSFEGPGIRNYLLASRSLRHIVKDKHYDLVHVHYGLAGAAALMQKNCPVIITFHGSDLLGEINPRYKYTIGGRIKTIISRTASIGALERIIVSTKLQGKLWPLSTVTIPMGVNISLFAPMPFIEAREQLGYTYKKKLILFPANPRNPVKRFDIVKKAVTLLQEKGLDVDIVSLDNIPHNQVPVIMNACDVLVLTSIHEASPCVIKEAMACNLPIVSVNVGDVAERIEGVEGCYLCERNSQDVASKLRLVLESGQRVESRCKITEFSLQNIASRVLTVYNKVLITNN